MNVARWSLCLAMTIGAIGACLIGAFAQTGPAGRSTPPPAFDDFPRRPMPMPGHHLEWCGVSGRYMLLLENLEGYLLFDAASDAEGIKVPVPLQCDGAGDNIIAFEWPQGSFLADAHRIVRFNVEQGTTETVARFQSVNLGVGAGFSVSPDLKSIAYDPRHVRLTGEDVSSRFRLLPFVTGGHWHSAVIHWKADSSKLFHATSKRPVADVIMIVDPATGKTVRGVLPAGYNFMDGRFLDGGRELLVFMRPRNDLPADEVPGAVFRCSIAPFACRAVATDVDEVSMSEHGLIGAMTKIYRAGDRRSRYIADANVLPQKYVFQVLDADGCILVQQEMPGRGKPYAFFYLSPSGRHVTLSWIDITQECEIRGGGDVCKYGEIVELPALTCPGGRFPRRHPAGEQHLQKMPACMKPACDRTANHYHRWHPGAYLNR